MGGTKEDDALTVQVARARALDRQGRDLAAAGDIAAAAACWTEAADALRLAADGTALRLAETLERAAAASVQAGHPDAGSALAQEAVARLRVLHNNTGLPAPALAAKLGSLGQFFCVMQNWRMASDVLAEAEAWFGAAPDLDALRERVRILDALSAAHRFAGRPDAAIVALRQAAALGEMAVDASGSLDDRFQLSQLHNALGQILLEGNDAAAAMPVLQDCVGHVDALVAEAPAPHARNLLAAACNRLGHAHAALENRDAAIACFERSVALMRDLVETEGHAGLAEDLETAMHDLQRARVTRSVAFFP